MILFSKTEADASYHNAAARNLCNTLEMVLFIKNYKKLENKISHVHQCPKFHPKHTKKSQADYSAMLSGSF